MKTLKNPNNINDQIIKLISKKVLNSRGINLLQYKSTFLGRRINIRMKKNNIDSYLKYSSYLNNNPTEHNLLFKELSIIVTHFFRDNKIFTVFADKVITKLITETPNYRKIRIWSAGCATGEESFSIAILFYQKFIELNEKPRFEVIGTDVNPNVINKAKNGVYSINALKEMPKHLQKKYLSLTDQGNYKVNEKIMNSVKFQIVNLEKKPISAVFDVIFCRNVLIYFRREMQNKLIKNFHYSLRPSGYLVIGQSESIFGETMNLFKLIMLNERIYKKIGTPTY